MNTIPAPTDERLAELREAVAFYERRERVVTAELGQTQRHLADARAHLDRALARQPMRMGPVHGRTARR